jgi:hypothetical protein
MARVPVGRRPEGRTVAPAAWVKIRAPNAMLSVQLAHGRRRRRPQGDDETPQGGLQTHPNIPLLMQKHELMEDRNYLRLVACLSEPSDVTEAAYRAARRRRDSL